MFCDRHFLYHQRLEQQPDEGTCLNLRYDVKAFIICFCREGSRRSVTECGVDDYFNMKESPALRTASIIQFTRSLPSFIWFNRSAQFEFQQVECFYFLYLSEIFIFL